MYERTVHALAERVVPALVSIGYATCVLLAARAAHAGGKDWTALAFSSVTAALWIVFGVSFLMRHRSRGTGWSLIGTVAVFGAPLGAAVATAAGTDRASPALEIIGLALAAAGTGWALAGIIALGRCFGVLPEARGLVTRGPYRVVRHPIYAGEILALAGVLLPNISWAASAAWCGVVAVQSARARVEERVIAAEFPEYERYATTTPRLLPGLLRGARPQGPR